MRPFLEDTMRDSDPVVRWTLRLTAIGMVAAIVTLFIVLGVTMP